MPGTVQGRTEMSFGSVRNVPSLLHLAGAMSGSSLPTAIAPHKTLRVVEPGSFAGGQMPVLRQLNPRELEPRRPAQRNRARVTTPPLGLACA